ncbi:MAG: hypothetical protein Q9196_003341 [Gyalolechia fulgens]
MVPINVELNELKDLRQRAKLHDYQERVSALEGDVYVLQSHQVDICVGNLLVAFLHKALATLGKKKKDVSNDGTQDSSHNVKVEAASAIKRDDYKRWGLPAAYFNLMNNDLQKFIHKRNLAAHESHYLFARLMLRPRWAASYQHRLWQPMYKFVYGGSDAEVLAQEPPEDSELLQYSLQV